MTQVVQLTRKQLDDILQQAYREGRRESIREVKKAVFHSKDIMEVFAYKQLTPYKLPDGCLLQRTSPGSPYWTGESVRAEYERINGTQCPF